MAGSLSGGIHETKISAMLTIALTMVNRSRKIDGRGRSSENTNSQNDVMARAAKFSDTPVFVMATGLNLARQNL